MVSICLFGSQIWNCRPAAMMHRAHCWREFWGLRRVHLEVCARGAARSRFAAVYKTWCAVFASTMRSGCWVRVLRGCRWIAGRVSRRRHWRTLTVCLEQRARQSISGWLTKRFVVVCAPSQASIYRQLLAAAVSKRQPSTPERDPLKTEDSLTIQCTQGWEINRPCCL